MSFGLNGRKWCSFRERGDGSETGTMVFEKGATTGSNKEPTRNGETRFPTGWLPGARRREAL
jgi:hypothetical protein